jgi:hypothetical protein
LQIIAAILEWPAIEQSHTTLRPDSSGLGALVVLGIAFVRRSSHQNSPWAGAAHRLQERTETGRCMAAQRGDA